FLHGLLKLLAVLVDRYADDDKSTIVELRMEFLEQGKLPRTDASPGCPEMEQDNLAADLVRTQTLTCSCRDKELGRFVSNGQIIDFVNIPSRRSCKVRTRQNLCDFLKRRLRLWKLA